MRRLTKKCLRGLPSVLLLLAFLHVSAQKLPNVQKESLQAPANVKIDGIPTEWKNQFQAYNHATEIFYTIANNNDNLYLIIQATAPAIIRKIIAGGISFTISKSADRKDKNAATITFPVLDVNNKPNIRYNIPDAESGSERSIDSIVNANNQNLTDRLKLIKVKGIKTTDTLISIYNNKGIKIRPLFDNKMAYTCETEIALKLIDLSPDYTDKLLYHIQLNAVNLKDLNGITVLPATANSPGKIQIKMGAVSMRDINESGATTDFWGEYKLIKSNDR